MEQKHIDLLLMNFLNTNMGRGTVVSNIYKSTEFIYTCGKFPDNSCFSVFLDF